jgi:hypothetical protein
MRKYGLVVLFIIFFFMGSLSGFFVKKFFFKEPHYNNYHSVIVKNQSQGAIGNIKIAKWNFDVGNEGEEELMCPSTSKYQIFTVTIRDRRKGEKK